MKYDKVVSFTADIFIASRNTWPDLDCMCTNECEVWGGEIGGSRVQSGKISWEMKQN